ncbi:hypothetical protein [Streptomyces flavidovirens]|uniref:hypothetical protein n=1 Tax=Streptomyces flavidovirens TaxID=67298 RepID=UPI0004225D50|nr:hypothetical protein [Streptomyces flavidovirens]
MSAAAFAPGPSAHRNRNRNPRADGAPAHSVHSTHSVHFAHRIGKAVHAVKVFAGAAFSVAVLGEYAQEAGVKRR